MPRSLINRSERTLARWVREGLIAPPPAAGYAKAGGISRAARQLPVPEPGQTATDVLLQMREDERQ